MRPMSTASAIARSDSGVSNGIDPLTSSAQMRSIATVRAKAGAGAL